MKETRVFDGDIKIFSPRYSGKSTFLAALANHYYFSPDKRPILSIQAGNASGEHLIEMARDILLNEAMLPPMADIDSYYLSITSEVTLIKKQPISMKGISKLAPYVQNIVELRAYYTPYAGEWFEMLKTSGDSLTPSIEYIFDDLAAANQVIFLFDSTSSRLDDQYAQAVSALSNQLYKRRNSADDEKRYAIVFSKMDLFPGFSGLSDLDHLNSSIKIKFPKLFFEFQKWSRHENCSFRYFACSAFGMIGNPPIPNAVRATNVGSDVDAGCGWVIRKPEFWQPSGLVSPIYWLLSGDKDDPILLDYPSFS